ncbi:hypothetical protein CU665_10430 [Pseudomonas syringae pv. actinidifoliorum]|nr:hypothetical protein [Pseudomonas syringae pv. actinidifoliorum]
MLSMPECLWGNGAVCTSGVSGWARKIGGVVGGNDSMILGIIQMMSFVEGMLWCGYRDWGLFMLLACLRWFPDLLDRSHAACAVLISWSHTF